MTLSALVCTVWLIFPPDGPAPQAAATVKEYEAAKANAGRDPKSQVELALWCEARGMDAERAKHLALAVLADPANVTARGLLGLMSYAGRWESPDQVVRRIKDDAALSDKLAEYNRRRAEMIERIERPGRLHRLSVAEIAHAHYRLALWCDQVRLKAEAEAHFTSSVVRDPHLDEAWKHLGYVKHLGRWMSHEQIAAEREEAEAQRHADRHWEPLLHKWRAWLADKDADRRREAQANLADVIDPRAVASIGRVFLAGTPSGHEVAVQMLGQIDTAASSRKLAEIAVMSPSAAARSAAIAGLKRRDPRDFGGMLVEMIRTPMSYRAEPVRGPGSPGGLIVDTPRFRMLRTYDAPVAVKLGGFKNGYIGYDANGMPVAASHSEVNRLGREKPGEAVADLSRIEARTREMIAEANIKASVSQQRLIADIQAIEAENARIAETNRWVIPVLTGALGAPESLAEDEDAWHKWWYDKIGYRYVSPPRVTVAVNASPQYPPPVIISCFVAGTPVRTPDGHRPIETLVAGDQVLTQDTTTGELSFQPVLVVHHNPPGATFRITLDNGDTLTPSVYHRFWRAGQGWVIARDLKAGDVLRTLSGLSRVATVTEGPVVPVFNLDVAKARTFFVGKHDALVHDNTMPALRARIFDAISPTEQSGAAK